MQDLLRPPRRKRDASGGHSKYCRNAFLCSVDCSVNKCPCLSAWTSVPFGGLFASWARRVKSCSVWPATSRPRFCGAIAACCRIGSGKKLSLGLSEIAGHHPTNPFCWSGSHGGRKHSRHEKTDTHI